MVDKVALKLINMLDFLADEYKNLILATFHLKLIKTLRVSRHFYIISIESNLEGIILLAEGNPVNAL